MTHPLKREVHTKAYELSEKRKLANAEILNRLYKYLIANPGLRFSQALFNLGIVESNHCMSKDNTHVWHDDYYVEPEDVLKRMR